jgi:hypothetical protein
MSSRQRSAPFSTHARGVPLFDRGRFLDVPRHASRALLDLRDIGSSAFWFYSMQSWLTVWSVGVNIIAGAPAPPDRRHAAPPLLRRCPAAPGFLPLACASAHSPTRR